MGTETAIRSIKPTDYSFIQIGWCIIPYFRLRDKLVRSSISAALTLLFKKHADLPNLMRSLYVFDINIRILTGSALVEE
jgi:hypothetical protein